ncbi:hypothetical protein EYR40_004223 [Pleurotus pulmonarius]|nr:hypothetical protein EYR36_007208 [Pleurotus pulmonarius]KAF4605439.1 hypothetical protein EYR40_004223 [Pleurotus pulmonarius]KAF4606928.1 hypothetical protein EYR38_000983 [Pleurotus pulmonarius]
MLKRQRPSSPFPSSSDAPIACDPYNDLHLPPATKRQRTAPPSLDGPSRGWGISHTAETSPNADDGEDDSECDEEDDEINCASNTEARLIREKYKSTNTMLSQLHSFHQERILTPSAPQLRSTPLAPTSEAKWTNPPIVGGVNRADARRSSKNEGNVAPLTESQDPTEKYKQTNKLLGDLVLSRRRQIDGSS